MFYSVWWTTENEILVQWSKHFWNISWHQHHTKQHHVWNFVDFLIKLNQTLHYNVKTLQKRYNVNRTVDMDFNDSWCMAIKIDFVYSPCSWLIWSIFIRQNWKIELSAHLRIKYFLLDHTESLRNTLRARCQEKEKHSFGWILKKCTVILQQLTLVLV